MRSPPISRRSRCRCSRARRCCSKPIWSTWWPPAQPTAQAAIASRAMLPRSLAAAIAEVGSAQACLALLENLDADIAPFSIDRIVERFGHLAAIRETLMARDDLPMATRQALLSKLSQTLAGFVAARQWLGPEHAEYAAREACEKATVALAAETPYEEVGRPGAASAPERTAHRRHDPARAALRQCGAVRGGAGGIVRPAARSRHQLYPRQEYFRLPRALPQGRAAGSAPIRRSAKRSRRCARACWSASRAGRRGSSGAWSSACWRACAASAVRDLASLLALLRRFAVEAAREEARMFCDDLVANDDPIDAGRLHRRRAAGGVALVSSSAGSAISTAVRPVESGDPATRATSHVWMPAFAGMSGERRGASIQDVWIYSGAIDGPMICSSTSGRPRFSWMRNSSVTSRNRLVSVVGQLLGVGAGIFAIDRAHRIDVLIHQLDRNAGHVGRVLDQPAQAVGGRRHQRKSEGRGFALDVMGGVEQGVLVGLGEAAVGDVAAGLVEPLAFGIHPGGEFRRQVRPAPFPRARPDRLRRATAACWRPPCAACFPA